MAVSLTDIARDLIIDFETRGDDLIRTEIEYDATYGNEVWVTFENKAERRIEEALKRAAEAALKGELIDV
ncbi:hypothetical protein [Roseibium album]|uniref:hypothetical protein n=1 Tax=Roseibium album TaxID=311410 RepID=UPI003BAFCC5B